MKPNKAYRLFTKISKLSEDFVFQFHILKDNKFYITGIYKNGEDWLLDDSVPMPDFNHIRYVYNCAWLMTRLLPNINISYKTISNEIVITNSIVADTFCK